MPQTNVIIEIRHVLLFTLYNSKNIAYHITEELIFDAEKIMVMGNYKNLCVFNFATSLKSRNHTTVIHIIHCFCYNFKIPDHMTTASAYEFTKD